MQDVALLAPFLRAQYVAAPIQPPGSQISQSNSPSALSLRGHWRCDPRLVETRINVDIDLTKEGRLILVKRDPLPCSVAPPSHATGRRFV